MSIVIWPQASPGDVWLEPVETYVVSGQVFATEVHVNTGTQDLLTYNIHFNSNKNVMHLYSIENPPRESGLPCYGPSTPTLDSPAVLEAALPDTDIYY